MSAILYVDPVRSVRAYGTVRTPRVDAKAECMPRDAVDPLNARSGRRRLDSKLHMYKIENLAHTLITLYELRPLARKVTSVTWKVPL